jgi:hypothetical protein
MRPSACSRISGQYFASAPFIGTPFVAAVNAMPNRGAFQVRNRFFSMRGFLFAYFTGQIDNFHFSDYLRSTYYNILAFLAILRADGGLEGIRFLLNFAAANSILSQSQASRRLLLRSLLDA